MFRLRARMMLAAVITVATMSGTAPAAVADKLKPLADGYPSRPITIVVPYGAGGGADQVTRALAAAIEEVADIRFQIETKPGGGGLAAMPDFMSRPKDGYTFLEHDDGLISAIAADRADIKPGRDIEPICVVQATFGQIYIRSQETRFTDWKSFVAYAKANPGQLRMSNSASSAAMEAVQTAALEKAAGIQLRQVGFDKPAARYGALLGGHADVLFEQPGDVNAFIKSKKMKPILTLLSERPKEFSSVPALKDTGLSVPDMQRVRMFWVHAGVPEERKAYLRKACERAYKTDSFQEFNKKKYMHIGRSYYDSQDALVLVNRMIEDFRAAYKEIGLLK